MVEGVIHSRAWIPNQKIYMSKVVTDESVGFSPVLTMLSFVIFTSIDEDRFLVFPTSFLMKPDGSDGPTFRRTPYLGDGDEVRKRQLQIVQITVNIYKLKSSKLSC